MILRDLYNFFTSKNIDCFIEYDYLYFSGLLDINCDNKVRVCKAIRFKDNKLMFLSPTFIELDFTPSNFIESLVNNKIKIKEIEDKILFKTQKNICNNKKCLHHNKNNYCNILITTIKCNFFKEKNKKSRF